MKQASRTADAAAPTRRQALGIGATLVGGTLLIGCSPALTAKALSLGAKNDFGAFGPFIKVAPDGTVTVVSKHIELGQGSHAGLAAIAAEEMDADWDKVKVEQAPANASAYANGAFGIQATGGSTSIFNSWTQLRNAGAAARAMFVQAAASGWNAPLGEITVQNGVVSHAKSGRQAHFGELLDAAAKVKPPQTPTLKDPKAFALVGSGRVKRKDAAAKATGTARFTQDVHLPGMLTAMVAHSPKFGATVASFDARAARKVPGVVDVFQIPTGVAVVAQNTWAARQGRDALSVKWDESKAETRGTDQLRAEWTALAAGQPPADPKLKWFPFVAKGDAAKAARDAAALEVTYDFPYLAHAPMEPLNCVAIVDGHSAKLIHGSQVPTLDQANTAMIVGTLPGSVEIETLFAGGSFGRRGNYQTDFVTECVHVAKHVGHGRPVKLVWTREDDMRAGYYRPMVHHAVRVTVDKDGYPATWRHRLVTQALGKGSAVYKGGLDPFAVEGVKDSPYLKATPVVDAQAMHPDLAVTVNFWRSVGASHTAFVMEHTVDQLAKRAGKDPVDYRRALYAKAGDARRLATLNLAAEKAGWTSPAPAGWTRGVAVHECFGTVVAQVAEVRMEGAEPRVGRVVTAVDCGTAVAPDLIAAQMEGGTCFGLSSALFGKIDLQKGEVQQANFDSYRVLRHNEAPTVETYIVPSANPPSGAGEPGTPVIGPAVANALLAMGHPPTTSLPMVKG